MTPSASEAPPPPPPLWLVCPGASPNDGEGTARATCCVGGVVTCGERASVGCDGAVVTGPAGGGKFTSMIAPSELTWAPAARAAAARPDLAVARAAAGRRAATGVEARDVRCLAGAADGFTIGRGGGADAGARAIAAAVRGGAGSCGGAAAGAAS